MALYRTYQACPSISSLQPHPNNLQGAIEAGESMHASQNTTAEHDQISLECYSPIEVTKSQRI